MNMFTVTLYGRLVFLLRVVVFTLITIDV